MANTTPRKTLLFKDLNDSREIELREPGTYFLGLATDGSLCAEKDEESLCVKLFQFIFEFDGGCLLAPLNRDLTCKINSTEELSKEVNLIHGTTLEIAEKKILFDDGRIPRRKRHLPKTPGLSRELIPPPKPARLGVQNGTISSPTVNKEDVDSDDEEKKWLASSCVMMDLVSDQQHKLNDLNTPEQISVLAASYFTKQLRMFTDAIVTGQLIDDIFKLFIDTVEECKDSYMMYLSSVSQTLGKATDKSHSLPMHRPAVRLATDLLRSCFDPISRVILILSFLRTFSHFVSNLPMMIRCQTTAAVIGSMTAFNSTAIVQQHGLDILSKIATYVPKLGEKPPLKEDGMEQVIRGVKQHSDIEDIGHAVCRVFANLSSTLDSCLNDWLDSGIIDTQQKFQSLERIQILQDFVYKEGIPVAESIADKFSQNLGVKMDFRRLVRFYANYQHFKLKKAKWLTERPIEFQHQLNNTLYLRDSDNGLTCSSIGKDSVKDLFVVTDKQTFTQTEEAGAYSADPGKERQSSVESPPGILKKSRSYECLRTSERKLNFNSDTYGGSDSETSSDSDSNSDPEFHGPFDSGMPMEIDMEDDFSFHLVQHLVRKTVKRKKRRPVYSDKSSTDTDDSDREFLDSMSYPNSKARNPQAERQVEASPLNVSEINQQGMNQIEIEDNLKDVYFLAKLVQTQIITHVIAMVLQGEDSKVLQIIDSPVNSLLQEIGTNLAILQFAENHYDEKMTLMDLEPGLVISLIDAVRYRTVAVDLLYSSLQSLTEVMANMLQISTINTAMMFFSRLFSNPHLHPALTDKDFIQKFRKCLQKITIPQEVVIPAVILDLLKD